ncbi:hypothetical protein AMJ80_04590 [bacterium SM23_31]|nr:MAG: hypothetical protein AMJ80_04590 [bacterium SM23_31]
MATKICKIAVDAMGGDYAPAAIIEGVKLTTSQAHGRFKVILVGDADKINRIAPDLSDFDDTISVEHTPEVVSMSDHPVDALKGKKNSSIAKIADMLREGNVDAIFSAGNTGAFMAASMLAAGKIEGVIRPSIGVFYPTYTGTSFLLDIGANTDCKPRHLFHFGIMGATFVKYFLNTEKPRIGLLNIGEEPSKGNAATIEAHNLLRSSSLNFVGNIEGRDIFAGAADVVVCDGFVGNILLKLFETYGTAFEVIFQKKLGNNLFYRIGKILLRKPLIQYKEMYNYEHHGGVPLLGINGVSMIGHGHSSPQAIKSALFSAMTIFERDIQGEIRKEIAQYKENS